MKLLAESVIVQPLIFLAVMVKVFEVEPLYMPLPVMVTVAVPMFVLLEYETE